MNTEKTSHHLPAPCIIESGLVINKDDMRRLLNDLSRVHYIHILDGKIENEGEGWILDVFNDPTQSTIIANRSIYINLQSFDYLELLQTPEAQTHFDLIQDNRRLRLVPLSHCCQNSGDDSTVDDDTLEAMLTEVFAAKWEMQQDNF
jgi:hypothetical protein